MFMGCRMQLTRHTDFALRLLIQLAGTEGARATVAQVAETQRVPRNHLTKITNDLAHHGFIVTRRGRGGGIALARPPAEIRIGEVIAAMEPGCSLVDCSGCRVAARCTLPRHLNRAMSAFFGVLNQQTLADVIGIRGSTRTL